MGPTRVFPRSHTRYARRAALQEQRLAEAGGAAFARAAFYSSDGEGGPRPNLVSLHEEGNAAAQHFMDAEMDAAEAEDAARETALFGDCQSPVEMLLQVGDAGAMDCRLRHHGSAYAYRWSGAPRVLLNATFGTGDLAGFTYHRSDSLEGCMPTLAELVA
jgi:hypothetical protein